MGDSVWANLAQFAGAAGIGGIIAKLIEMAGARRATTAAVDVSYSADSRAWAATFQEALKTQGAQHQAEMAAMATRITALEAQLQDARDRATELERENAMLTAEVKRLTARVAELEKSPSQGAV